MVRSRPSPANHLYYGDNLDVLREHIGSDTVDLVYLDPPFNSNRRYSLLFKEKSGRESQAQMEAFDDTWTWSQDAESTYVELMNSAAPGGAKDALEAMRRLLGDNDVLAYLVMMTVRLVELRRVLKGIFVCMQPPTKGMTEAANRSGFYHHPANAQRFPRVQIFTVQDLLDGRRPAMPPALLPYFQAQRRYGVEVEPDRLF